MAIVKHIKSRNANYSAAINYLLFEHDEKTGKKIVDESGRSIMRKEFYMDGLNCDPMSFDKECELTNAHFHKNKKREDIKSHHYIISYDPADVTENGLTGERAQSISLELAKQMFPGYQALVVTHTDGHNESGNIHTHIVINSVRKTAVERQLYMDKPHEEAAGYKHRSTDKFMNTFKKTVMDRCQQEGLHQIDLLAPAEKKSLRKSIWHRNTASKNWMRSIRRSSKMASNQHPLYSLHRKNICEMRLMNALPHPIVLMNSNPNFWNNFKSL